MTRAALAALLTLLSSCGGDDGGFPAAPPSTPVSIGHVEGGDSGGHSRFLDRSTIAALSDRQGGMFVAWRTCAGTIDCSSPDGDSVWSVWVRHYVAGKGWSPAVEVSAGRPRAGMWDFYPRLVPLRGGALLTWNEAAEPFLFGAAYVEPVGWLQPAPLPGDGSVATDADGAPWLAYRDGARLVLSRLDPAALVWTEQASTVSADGVLGFAGRDPLVTWADFGAVYSTRWIRGTGWTLASRVVADCNGCILGTAETASGPFVVVSSFVQDPGSIELIPPGSTGPALRLNGSASSVFPAVIAATADARALAIWPEVAPGASRYTLAGRGYPSGAKLAFTEPPRAVWNPAVALRRDGEGWAAWLELRGDTPVVRAARVSVGGATGPAIDVSDRAVDPGAYPVVVVDDGGTAWLFWSQLGPDGVADVYGLTLPQVAARFSPPLTPGWG